MIINKEKAIIAFKEYVSGFNINDERISLKITHTYRVADNSVNLAESLGLTIDDQNLSWLIGLLHDVGRFSQIDRYGTFDDNVSVDHAELGADLLFKYDYVWNFIDSNSEKNELSIIDTAIREHNKFELRNDLSDREAMFCRVIRDADKLDIFRVVTENTTEATWGVTIDELYQSGISDDVIRLVKEKKQVRKEYRITPLDKLIGSASMVFGLNADYSLELARKQGYLKRILSKGSMFGEKNKEYEEIRNIIITYVEGSAC